MHRKYEFNLIATFIFQILFTMTGIIGLILTADWTFIFPSIVLILALIIIRYLYIPTARSLKRLEAASKYFYFINICKYFQAWYYMTLGLPESVCVYEFKENAFLLHFFIFTNDFVSP